MKTVATLPVHNATWCTKKKQHLKRMAAVLAACLSVLCVAPVVIAQPTDARVTFTVAAPGMVTGVFYVLLPDSTGFSDVEVALTDNLQDSMVFSRVFAFDQTAGLPTGVSWMREGKQVYLGMGTHAQSVSWQGKARLKATGGAWSDWYAFRFN